MKHGCMVMTVRLSSSRRSGSRQIHHGRKKRVKFAAMLSPCWSPPDIQGIVHREFVPPGQTVNGKFYCEVLKRLREGIWRKRPDKWKKNNEKQWQRARPHIICCSTIPDFQKHYSDSPPTSLFAWPRPLLLFPIPQDEIMTERASFWHDWGDPRRNARGYGHTHIWELPGMHEIMGNNAGIALYMPKGATSKETVETRSYSKKLLFGQIPRIFG